MDKIKEFYDLFSPNQLQPETVFENKAKQISTKLKEAVGQILDGSLGVDILTVESNTWLRHILGRISDKSLPELGLDKSDVVAAIEKLSILMTTSRGVDQILNTQLSSTLYVTANSNVHKNVLGNWQFVETNSPFFADKLKNGKVNFLVLVKNKAKFTPNKVTFDIKFGILNNVIIFVEFINGVPKKVESFYFEFSDKNQNLELILGSVKILLSKKEA